MLRRRSSLNPTVPSSSLSAEFLSSSRRDYSAASFRTTPAASPLAALLVNHGLSYPTPVNLSYFWNFGSLSALCLGLQLLSGIFLAMHYTAALSLAFDSVEHIMRDVSGGWFIRYLHANGASAFFAVVYLHMFRGLLYQSYRHPNRAVWLSGVALFVLMMATAFIGYVLPWGQMSFWGATVITNLFSVIPLVGPSLVQWLWGGFAVGGATLSRFYSLHYLLPFLLVALALLHIFALHQQGSSNPLGGESREVATFSLPLYPYFLVKDLLGALIFAAVLGGFIFYAPNLLGHSDNYIEANSLVTPEHIVPEWYFRAPKWALAFARGIRMPLASGEGWKPLPGVGRVPLRRRVVAEAAAVAFGSALPTHPLRRRVREAANPAPGSSGARRPARLG